MKLQKKHYYFTLIFYIFLIFISQLLLAKNKYDSDFIIKHYDIFLQPNFNENAITIQVTVSVQNISRSADKMIIWLCAQGNTDDFDPEIRSISRIQSDHKIELDYHQTTIPEFNLPLYEILLGRQINHKEEFQLTFDYQIRGKKSEEGFPICKGPEKELYLISDFRWLPLVNKVSSPGTFAALYRPTWSLKIIYPSPYTAAVDGRLIKRSQQNGTVTDLWKSVSTGMPQVFISQYQVIKGKKDQFTLETYCPRKQIFSEATEKLNDDIFKILSIYFDLYGNPGSTTYRLIATHTPWGGHGLFMGQAIHQNYLQSLDLKTIAHEIAHTWWGIAITSCHEGSKFLREGMANFSAAWALGLIKGKEYANNFWREFKWRTFTPYYIALDQEKTQYPIIIQDGYDYRGSVNASYRKGALVLNTLRLEMGDKTFFSALKTLSTEYKNKNITMSDFIEMLNRKADKDMTPIIKNLCWKTGHPVYSVVDFISVKRGGKYKTSVIIKNEGEFGVLCPLELTMENKEKKEWFKVDGDSKKEFVFITVDEVKKVIIDPDITAFHYHPDQKFKLWDKFDTSYFSLRNWLWFNKSFAYYIMGNPEKAVAVLSQYFQKSIEHKNIMSLKGLSEHFICGSYLFTRAFYYCALHDWENAEQDIRLSIPTLLDALINKSTQAVITRCGIIKEPEAEKQILDILSMVTGKQFFLDSEMDEEAKKTKVKEWKEWWKKDGNTLTINVDGLYEKYRISEVKQ